MTSSLRRSLPRIFAFTSLAVGASAIGYHYQQQQQQRRHPSAPRTETRSPTRGPPFHSQTAATSATTPAMAAIPADLAPWQATFAVPMHCESCVSAVEGALRPIKGIQSLSASLPTQLVTVTSKLPPSTIQRALATIGKDAILRGSGLPDSAAVAILETYSPHLPAGSSPVRGLVRLVQVRDDLLLCDVGVSNLHRHLPPSSAARGIWAASVRQTGDLSEGPQSTGRVWTGAAAGPSPEGTLQATKGFLGLVEVDDHGQGAAVFVKQHVPIWELIGRGLVLEKVAVQTVDEPVPLPLPFKQQSSTTAEAGDGRPGADAIVGVIARSAGVWDNDKTVCSCSGKTVWEERDEQRGRGML